MSINLDGAKIMNNGGYGIVVVGDGSVSAQRAEISGNIGGGVLQREPTLVERLGFTDEIKPKEVAELLQLLVSLPEEARREAARTSGLAAKYRALAVDGSAVLNNLVSVAGSPLVQGWITQLSGGGS